MLLLLLVVVVCRWCHYRCLASHVLTRVSRWCYCDVLTCAAVRSTSSMGSLSYGGETLTPPGSGIVGHGDGGSGGDSGATDASPPKMHGFESGSARMPVTPLATVPLRTYTKQFLADPDDAVGTAVSDLFALGRCVQNVIDVSDAVSRCLIHCRCLYTLYCHYVSLTHSHPLTHSLSLPLSLPLSLSQLTHSHSLSHPHPSLTRTLSLSLSLSLSQLTLSALTAPIFAGYSLLI